MAAAMTALIVHGLLDGAGLAAARHDATMASLGWGVVLHRIPVGLAIWWTVTPSRGARSAVLVIGLVALATVGGFVSSASLFSELSVKAIALVQALVAGSLLHVVVAHAPEPLSRASHAHRHHAAAGAMLAVALLLLLGLDHEAHGAPQHAHTLRVDDALFTLAARCAPALLVGLGLAAAVKGLLPPLGAARLATKRPLAASLLGAAFGVSLRICSCAVQPVYRRLLRHGASPSAATAFVLVTPGASAESFGLTLLLLGAPLAGARIAVVLIAACLLGLIVTRRDAAHRETAATKPEAETEPIGQRIRHGAHFALTELVDHVGPWVVVGLGVAALIDALTPHELHHVDAWVAVPAFAITAGAALLSVPVYVCATGTTIVAAVLIAKGVSPGAALALLAAGPATGIATHRAVSETIGRGRAWLFSAAVISVSVAAGLLVDRYGLLGTLRGLTAHHAAQATTMELACLAIWAILLAASLWRQGPRGMLGQVIEPHEDLHAHHDHSGSH
jgi:uncharacterized membrane protein YraQ (UPF0718 family)